MTAVRTVGRRRRAAFAIVLTSFLMAAAAPARSVTEGAGEAARRQRVAAAAARAAALADLDEAVIAYEAINAEFQQLTFRMGQLRSMIDSYAEQASDLQATVRARAVEAYIHGERDDASLLFSSDSVQQAMVARQVLARAVEGEVQALASLVAARREMELLQEELDADSERVADLRFEAEMVAARMNELFALAEQDLAEAETDLAVVTEELAEQRRREEEERRRREEERRRQEALARARAGPAGGITLDLTPGFICPVAGPSRFIDSWGAPRSGGRTHKGTDMMAPRGTPLVAVANGTVRLSRNALGGNIVWIYSDYGVGFFYAHLDGYADGLRSGDRVSIGQKLGTVGDTGNPAPGAYHLHFGIATSGGSANVNPYPSLRAVCS